MAYSLVWLPEVLRNAGLKVAEVEGWANRGRGDMGRVRGVICHHTGTSTAGNMPTLNMLKTGRSDLPGPLSQLGLGRDGTYYVVAAGRANHAGNGRWAGLATGNSSFVGIEAENGGGPRDEWPDVQMDAYFRGVAAILKQIGAGPEMCCGHKEFAPDRKIDPRFDMARFRYTVGAIMQGSGFIRPLIPDSDPDTGKPTLKRGARGDNVLLVQKQLHLGEDGRYGPATEAAVRAFQKKNNLVPDGIVGPKTWTVIFSSVATAGTLHNRPRRSRSNGVSAEIVGIASAAIPEPNRNPA